MGLNAKTKKEKYDKIKECKKNTTIEELCWGHPEEFALFAKYVWGLSFEEKPDYSYCRKLFHTVMKKQGMKYDYEYDWVLLKKSKKEIINQENKVEKAKEEEKVETPAPRVLTGGPKAPSKPYLHKNQIKPKVPERHPLLAHQSMNKSKKQF